MTNNIPEDLDVRTARQKPIDVQTVLATAENLASIVEWIISNGHHAVLGADQLTIQTLEGPFTVRQGDYVMRGAFGEFSRCDPEAYELTYDDLGSVSA